MTLNRFGGNTLLGVDCRLRVPRSDDVKAFRVAERFLFFQRGTQFFDMRGVETVNVFLVVAGIAVWMKRNAVDIVHIVWVGFAQAAAPAFVVADVAGVAVPEKQIILVFLLQSLVGVLQIFQILLRPHHRVAGFIEHLPDLDLVPPGADAVVKITPVDVKRGIEHDDAGLGVFFDVLAVIEERVIRRFSFRSLIAEQKSHSGGDAEERFHAVFVIFVNGGADDVRREFPRFAFDQNPSSPDSHIPHSGKTRDASDGVPGAASSEICRVGGILIAVVDDAFVLIHSDAPARRETLVVNRRMQDGDVAEGGDLFSVAAEFQLEGSELICGNGDCSGIAGESVLRSFAVLLQSDGQNLADCIVMDGNKDKFRLLRSRICA